MALYPLRQRSEVKGHRSGTDLRWPSFCVVAVLACLAPVVAQSKLIKVSLEYRAPADGKPSPNFSPKGTQVRLTDLGPAVALPPGAVRPARKGMIEIGPIQSSWVGVLATASAEHPADLCQLFVDRNRNGDFSDDGPALKATPTQNDKTKAWWTSINAIELSVPYGGGVTERYLVSAWIVREDGAPAPDIVRYSVRSWRQGTININGVDALVAVMDSDNNALFDQADTWSAMAASEPNAAGAVLNINEARPTNRLMFLKSGSKEIAIEFKGMSRDGRSLDVAVVDAHVTKAEDRAPDDLVRDERPRPRTDAPVAWGHGSAGFTAALTRAKAEHKLVIVDFEATWCGPCHTMDEWVWNDAEVAAGLRAGYAGVKIDADLEKDLVKRFNPGGYPTMIVLDANGKEVRRVSGYQSSKQMLTFLK
jgi:thiol-disulfide isomerase/thioredoxin